MYIIIPLVIIAVSIMAVGAIVWRKFPYLKKLSADSASIPENGLLAGFFPEARNYLKKIDLSIYRDLFFKELEKFLRRLRVVSLKLDSFTRHLIDKIRANGSEKETIEHLTPLPPDSLESKVATPAIEEHNLIIEIAKNPKNAGLYKKLADLYILAENFSDAAESLETSLKLDPDDKKTEAKLRAVRKHLPE